MADDKDYEVGYGRPPKATQWVKGESGNISGKRKQPPSVKAILTKRLAAKVVVKQDGRVLKLSSLEALLRSLIAQAAKGNAPAMKMLFAMMQRYGLDIDAPVPDPEMDLKQYKMLHLAVGRMIDKIENTGDSSVLRPEELSEIFYAADSNIVQMELPLSGTAASTDAPTPTPQAPLIDHQPTTDGEYDDIMF